MSKNSKNTRIYTIAPILTIFILGFIAITVFAVFSSISDISIILLTLFVILGFAVSFAATVVIFRIIYSKMQAGAVLDDNVSDLECNLTLNLLTDLYMPVVLVNNLGKIIWYNQSFAVLADGRGMLYGKNFSDYCPIRSEALLNEQSSTETVITAFGSFYNIKAYDMSFENNNMMLTVWNDCTELENTKRRLEEESPVVAFIVIDNLDELIQYAQESYRSASAEVEGILRSWADSINGIFREYERDKFLLVFRKSYLASFVASKFDILDKIRNVRVGDGSLPVTVSMGIADFDGDFSDKEKSSRAALDMALQRGGDQVVLKTSDGIEFYGGKVQTSQKRTKVRARVVAEEIAHLIKKSSNVLVMAHVYPDFDAIGACIGAARLCMFCNTKVNIVTNLDSPEFNKCFDRLKNVSDYSQREVFIDFAQAQELLSSETLLIIVDVNNRNQFESPELADAAHKIVVIDHHRKAPHFSYEPLVTYIEPAASSTCELVGEMLEHMLSPGVILREEADIILAGIMLDTKRFSRNTGSRTFGAALYLRNEGADPSRAEELFKTELSDIISEASFESNVIIYRSSIAISQSSDKNNLYDSGRRIAAAKAADKLLQVEGVSASFVICGSGDIIHISARSNGKMNVQLVLEKLGGGGHYDSAATQLHSLTMTQTLTRLKKAIDEYLEENQN